MTLILLFLGLEIQICGLRELTWSPRQSERFSTILTSKSFLELPRFTSSNPGTYFSKIMREFQVLDRNPMCSKPGPRSSLAGLLPLPSASLYPSAHHLYPVLQAHRSLCHCSHAASPFGLLCFYTCSSFCFFFIPILPLKLREAE